MHTCDVFARAQAYQGVVLSVFFAGYATTQILGGKLADQLGGKLVLASGVAREPTASISRITCGVVVQGLEGPTQEQWSADIPCMGLPRTRVSVRPRVDWPLTSRQPFCSSAAHLQYASAILACHHAVWSLFTFLTPGAAAAGVAPLMLARVMLGVGEGVAFPSIHSLICKGCRRRRFVDRAGAGVCVVTSGKAAAGMVTPACNALFALLPCCSLLPARSAQRPSRQPHDRGGRRDGRVLCGHGPSVRGQPHDHQHLRLAVGLLRLLGPGTAVAAPLATRQSPGQLGP